MHVLHAGLDQKSIEFLAANRIVTHLVEDVENGEDLLDWAQSGFYDAIAVNLDTSGLGMYFPRVFRNKKLHTPIIGLVTRDKEKSFAEAQATFMENGGDYLIESPPNPRLLISTIRTSVRRFKGSTTDVLAFTLGDLSLKIDRTCAVVTLNAMQVHLTGKELLVLEGLAVGNGRVQSKEMILQGLYRVEEDEAEMKIIDVFVCKLRKKLAQMKDGGGEFVETVWGRGYRLRSDTMPPETAAAHVAAA